ncbi:lysophospholipase L1-like esterase [Alkalihalobacillus xiaoxiensis]|uniref:Lysophospholipase L1-like esterase n=1 Tax=Shouchella xiaoxiensis TaxID=766895 RepID=A0ABS2T0A1_9BACI|nr:SGNH/GDSL hydrolase family protein [Shouchella xiaoxiensis]MBM7841169.1 lysophospholipase L1-like esterase [Shouchella xiaoxiensis]
MKKTVFPLLIVLSLAGIIFSHFYYQNQVEEIANQAVNRTSPTSTASTNQEEQQQDEGTDIEIYEQGWLGNFLQLNDQQEHHVLFFGSDSLESTGSGQGWPEIVMEETSAAIDPLAIQTDLVIVDSDTISSNVTDKWLDDIIEAEPTILIAESLTLNDNSHAETIPPQESVEYLNEFFTDLKNELPELEIILVPSNPLVQASFYPIQINALNQQADSLPVHYFDHWPYWPEEPAERDLLLTNGKPNDDGQQLWADAFLEFFIDS